jgi:hypothetical protein
MKKFAILVALVAAIFSAKAEMDSVKFTLSAATTNVASQTYVIRGQIEGIYADVAANKTQTVAVATVEDTVLSKSLTADEMFYPRIVGNNDSGASTNVFASFVSAGDVTVTVTPAANTTGTNTTTVTVIYSK